jgi:protein-L-isoaspartate(D-aspartate) O-methyltransferase
VPGTPERPNTHALIQALRNSGLLADARIAAAFATVKREIFLPGIDLDEVYSDRAIVTRRDSAGTAVSSSSQPGMMAAMLDQLDLAPGMNVLEIGAGTGYNAAVMQAIVGAEGRVTTIEIDPEVAAAARENLYRAGFAQVNVVESDGVSGYAPRAAYDRIICTAAIWDVPRAWVRQLKPRGRLVTPIQLHAGQVSACLILQADGTLLSTDNRPCGFVLMRGTAAVPDLTRQIGSSGLTLLSPEASQIDSARLHLLLTEDHEINHLSMRLEPEEIWSGLMHYTLLNAPDDVLLATYRIPEGQKAYGIAEGSGYAIMGAASACFVPFQSGGTADCFAGSEAFLTAQAMLDQWQAIGKPSVDQLRVQLAAGADSPPASEIGRVYTRNDHDIHVWMEPLA